MVEESSERYTGGPVPEDARFLCSFGIGSVYAVGFWRLYTDESGTVEFQLTAYNHGAGLSSESSRSPRHEHPRSPS